MNLKDLDRELLKNPKYKKEYEKYDLAFEISQMLVEARIIKGVTQAKLAEMIKTKQSGIARAENGTVLPKLSFLKKIADAFHTSLIVKFAFMDKVDVKVSQYNSAPQRTQVAYAVIPQQPAWAIVSYEQSIRQGGLGI